MASSRQFFGGHSQLALAAAPAGDMVGRVSISGPPEPRTTGIVALAERLRQRVARAAELGEELANEIQEWSRSALTMRTYIAEDRLSWEVRVDAADPPFDAWGRLFGDALHNLRAALDNLTWGLASLGGSVPQRPTNIQFPIVAERSDWRSESRRIVELPEPAQRVIEAVQPYQRLLEDADPTADGLLLLHRLDVVDKHRLALQPELQPEELSHAFSVDFGSDENAALNVPPDMTLSADVFVTGTTILRHVTKSPIVQVKGEFTIRARVVVLDDWGRAHGVTYLLAALLQYVAMVMDLVLAAVLEATGDGA